jgi:hypothetical protein
VWRQNSAKIIILGHWGRFNMVPKFTHTLISSWCRTDRREPKKIGSTAITTSEL